MDTVTAMVMDTVTAMEWNMEERKNVMSSIKLLIEQDGFLGGKFICLLPLALNPVGTLMLLLITHDEIEGKQQFKRGFVKQN